jgi:hypothetical protein
MTRLVRRGVDLTTVLPSFRANEVGLRAKFKILQIGKSQKHDIFVIKQPKNIDMSDRLVYTCAYRIHRGIERKKTGKKETGEGSMPDGDIVHPSLSPRFRQLYLQVCEGALLEDDLARKALLCLKKEVAVFGDEPLYLIAQHAAFLEDLFHRVQGGEEINWANERRMLKQQQQFVRGHQRALGLVVRAGEDQLSELEKRSHYYLASPDYQRELTRQYLINVYDAQFAEPVATPLRPYVYQAEPDLVHQRLAAMRPDVVRGLESYVDQVMQSESVARLRCPANSPKEKIGPEMYELDIVDILRLK